MLTLERRMFIEDQIYSTVANLIPPGYKLNLFFSIDEKRDEKLVAEAIRAEVCRYFKLQIEDLFRKTRIARIATTRKFVCLFIKENTSLNLREIAKLSGYDKSNQQNHTNALHCINTLKDWIAIDDAIYFQYQELSQQIKINITR
jgi:chromosomal replication initiation ATPase DnaA